MRRIVLSLTSNREAGITSGSLPRFTMFVSGHKEAVHSKTSRIHS